MKRPSKRRRRRWKAMAANLPTRPAMSVKDLAKITGKSLKTSYKKVNAGFYPSIRLGRGQITVLTEPTLAILRGERPPGPLAGMSPAAAPADAQKMVPGLLPARPASAVKKRRPKRRGKSRVKPKAASKKGEAAPAAVTS
jgi:hypothetical protein